MAKSKVAPLNRQTIPRLELYGVLLVAKILDGVRTTLQSIYMLGLILPLFYIGEMDPPEH